MIRIELKKIVETPSVFIDLEFNILTSFNYFLPW